MKRNYWLRPVVLLILLSAITFNAVAQSKKANRQKPSAEPEVWQKISWEKWGVAFSIPPRLNLAGETPKSNPTRTDGYFGDTRYYERVRANQPNAPRFEVMVDITNWKGEKVEVEGGGKTFQMTPEQLLEIDYNADKNRMERENGPVKEVSYLLLDKIKGIYVQGNAVFDETEDKDPNTKIKIIWQTYRLYNGNVQRVLFSVEGQRKEIVTMKTIINSITFS